METPFGEIYVTRTARAAAQVFSSRSPLLGRMYSFSTART